MAQRPQTAATTEACDDMAMAAVACRVLVMKAAAVQAVLAKWAVAVWVIVHPP